MKMKQTNFLTKSPVLHLSVVFLFCTNTHMKVIDAVNLCNNSILTQVTVSGNLSNFPLMHNCFKHFYMTNTCRKISPKVFITYTYSPAILTRKIALKIQFGS